MPTTTTPSLAVELRFSVMRLRRRLANERHPDNELSLAQMAVLGCLAHRGELTLGELAAHERVQPPSMTRTVKALEADGFLVRRSCDDDGRVVRVALTDAGRATVLADRQRRDAWLSRRIAGLGEDERAVLAAAAPILERLANSEDPTT